MNTVGINKEKIREDMKKHGISAEQLSVSMGMGKTYIANLLARDVATPDVLAKVEKAMFREEGAYRTDKVGSPEEKTLIIRLLNEQLIEMKALRQDIASLKEEILSVENAVRDKVAYTHAIATSINSTIKEIAHEIK